MRILFDQGTPAPLRRALVGHVVETAFELGWSSLRNGDLIEDSEHPYHRADVPEWLHRTAGRLRARRSFEP